MFTNLAITEYRPLPKWTKPQENIGAPPSLSYLKLQYNQTQVGGAAHNGHLQPWDLEYQSVGNCKLSPRLGSIATPYHKPLSSLNFSTMNASEGLTMKSQTSHSYRKTIHFFGVSRVQLVLKCIAVNIFSSKMRIASTFL